MRQVSLKSQDSDVTLMEAHVIYFELVKFQFQFFQHRLKFNVLVSRSQVCYMATFAFQGLLGSHTIGTVSRQARSK